MPTSVISGDDIRFLVQQSPAQLTTIMGQMTTLVQGITNLQNDTNSRVEAMEKQGWFKRMVLTVSGKNKATKAEIQKNQDKVVSYVSQAVAQCYQMNCIDQQVICSLGNRMNQIYAQVNEAYNEQLVMKAQIAEIQQIQQETLQSLGRFVTALNEKIESVDNFHMLIEEIRLGRYSDESKLYGLCCVLSQLDKRTLEDERKLDILRGELSKRGIISEDSISVSAYLDEILSLTEDKVGTVYLELCNFRENFPANLFAEMIEAYHFLPKMEKMSKKKETIINRVLEKYELDDSAEFSYIDISESFIENKQNSIVEISTLQIGMNESEPELTDANSSYCENTDTVNDDIGDNYTPRYAHMFTDIDSEDVGAIGTKGRACVTICDMGIPLPFGFIINTEACIDYYDEGHFTKEIRTDISEILKQFEINRGKKFGDKTNPLFLSVRTSCKGSIPGLMEAVLNVGFNDEIVESFSKNPEKARWALDCYRRLITSYGVNVKGIDKSYFTNALNKLMKRYNVKEESNLNVEALNELVKQYKKIYKDYSNSEFPQSPKEQLFEIIEAAYCSWDNPEANAFRRDNDIPFSWGVAVIVQEMVFGNLNDKSGTGLLFSRSPITGEKALDGQIVYNAQGNDASAEESNIISLDVVKKENPGFYPLIEQCADMFEKHYIDMIYMEFTIENGLLYLLNVCRGDRTSEAAQEISKQLYEEGLITKSEANKMIFESAKSDAEKGYPEAQNELGLLYYKGEVVEEHLGNAAFWFQKAADQGYSVAQYNLGFCFYYGYGVEVNKIKSKNYFKQAADQGYEDAIEFLKENI